ncbi:MAG: nitronate monooxygenase [Polaromonas sp.]
MSTNLLRKLRLPVVAAPMFLVSGPDMVLAACKAGIIGAFPTPNARPIDVLEDWMRAITEGLAAARAADPDAVIGPWAANLVTHSSNTRLPEDLALIAKYQPPIVITALGSPKPAIEVVHGYGGIVLADVVNLTLAKKAVAAGADGLACVCVGAGGHTGNLSPFAFVSAIREFFDGLIVVGGGIADGFGVAGAIAAGADLVYMGTRFVPTTESMAKPEYKQMLVDCSVDDIVVSSGITGTPASWLKPSLRVAGLDPDNLPETPPRNYDSNRSLKTRKWVDTWTGGQGLGSIKQVQSVADVVQGLETQYHKAGVRFSQKLPAACGQVSA